MEKSCACGTCEGCVKAVGDTVFLGAVWNCGREVNTVDFARIFCRVAGILFGVVSSEELWGCACCSFDNINYIPHIAVKSLSVWHEINDCVTGSCDNEV